MRGIHRSPSGHRTNAARTTRTIYFRSQSATVRAGNGEESRPPAGSTGKRSPRADDPSRCFGGIDSAEIQHRSFSLVREDGRLIVPRRTVRVADRSSLNLTREMDVRSINREGERNKLHSVPNRLIGGFRIREMLGDIIDPEVFDRTIFEERFVLFAAERRRSI